MTDKEQRKAAKEFAEFWKGKGDEKGESQKFWLSLLRDVFGVEHPEGFISFEDRGFLGHTSFIDGYIADTKVLIEQKAIGKDLKAPIKQSDGTLLTPFQQAKRYVTELPVDKHPKFIITSNFQTFLVYDMNNPSGEPEERDPYLEEELVGFPYVNGGLFSDEDIEIPTFTEEIRTLLLSKASDEFNWSDISPTIFGAVFESTLNPETRRSGGMHYTSIENIHKVIDPLFLDDLKKELEEIKEIGVAKTRENKLKAYQEKLSKLVFFESKVQSMIQFSDGLAA